MAAVALFHQPQGHRDDVYRPVAGRGLRRRRHVVLDSPRVDGPGHPVQRFRGRRRGGLFPVLQRPAHRTRLHHGVLRRHAGDDRRFRQLVCAVDDRRPGHGLPAHEQHQLLAAGRGPGAVVGRRLHPGRPGHRLDRLSAAFQHRLPPRRGGGFRDSQPASGGRVVGPRRHQLHHHHRQHARTGHDHAPHAAVLLGDPGDGVHVAYGDPGVGGRADDAADGP